MKIESVRRTWGSYALEACLIVAIVGLVAPLAGLFTFTVIFGLPVIVFRQPAEIMVVWGWVGYFLAFVSAPITTGLACWWLLSLAGSRTAPYVGIVVPLAYGTIVINTPLGTRAFEAAQWLGEFLA